MIESCLIGIGLLIVPSTRTMPVMLALIGNAVKFSHDGGVVEVTASGVDETFWQVAVTDHGIGIEESEADAERDAGEGEHASELPAAQHADARGEAAPHVER